MLDSREVANEREELPPLFALRGEDLAAGRRDLVVAAPALSGFFDPTALDPFALFQLVERGVERREVERQRAAGSRLDELRELVAMARLVLEKGEDDELGGALLRLADRAGEFHRGDYILESRITSSGTRGRTRAPLAPCTRRQHLLAIRIVAPTRLDDAISTELVLRQRRERCFGRGTCMTPRGRPVKCGKRAS